MYKYRPSDCLLQRIFPRSLYYCPFPRDMTIVYMKVGVIPRFKRGIWKFTFDYDVLIKKEPANTAHGLVVRGRQRDIQTTDYRLKRYKMPFYSQNKAIPNEILDGIFCKEDLLDSEQSSKTHCTSRVKDECGKEENNVSSKSSNTCNQCCFCRHLKTHKNINSK